MCSSRSISNIVSIAQQSNLCSILYMKQLITDSASLSNTSIRSIIVSQLSSPFYVLIPCCKRLCSKNFLINSTIKSPSPCLELATLSPPQSWSCQLKSLAMIISSLAPVFCYICCIDCQVKLRICYRANQSFPSMYIKATRTSQSSKCTSTTVMSSKLTRICSSSKSFLAQIMLLIAYLLLLCVDSSTFT